MDHVQFNSISGAIVQNARAPKGLISSLYFSSLLFLVCFFHYFSVAVFSPTSVFFFISSGKGLLQ